MTLYNTHTHTHSNNDNDNYKDNHRDILKKIQNKKKLSFIISFFSFNNTIIMFMVDDNDNGDDSSGCH